MKKPGFSHLGLEVFFLGEAQNLLLGRVPGGSLPEKISILTEQSLLSYEPYPVCRRPGKGFLGEQSHAAAVRSGSFPLEKKNPYSLIYSDLQNDE